MLAFVSDLFRGDVGDGVRVFVDEVGDSLGSQSGEGTLRSLETEASGRCVETMNEVPVVTSPLYGL